MTFFFRFFFIFSLLTYVPDLVICICKSVETTNHYRNYYIIEKKKSILYLILLPDRDTFYLLAVKAILL